MISVLLFADDIALIAPCENKLQLLLDCVDEWCEQWRLSINGENTKVIHFRNVSTLQSDFDLHLDLKFHVREVCKSASRALSALNTKFISCGDFHRKVREPVRLVLKNLFLISESGW